MKNAVCERTKRPRFKGFSLIELLVVVAIIGILAAIVYPNYRRYVIRTHRTEGLSALQRMAARQERYFSNNSTYTVDLTDIKTTSPTEHGYYALTVTGKPCDDIGSCYTLTATAQGGQTEDTDCTTLTLTSAGQKSPIQCWGN